MYDTVTNLNLCFKILSVTIVIPVAGSEDKENDAFSSIENVVHFRLVLGDDNMTTRRQKAFIPNCPRSSFPEGSLEESNLFIVINETMKFPHMWGERGECIFMIKKFELIERAN